MFIRKNKNRSGSYSIQIVYKQRGSYKVLKTLGSGRSEQEIEFLYQRAQQELEKMDGSTSLFVNRDDAKLESFISDLSNSQVQVICPELIFGKIYDALGFNQIVSDLLFLCLRTQQIKDATEAMSVMHLFIQ